ncbi:MAG TPA: pyridoxamine 5'-phosphate oxidase family protein [Xanthobacteraceae bacterium]|nr:pyridoxamine 5'-phosphate oxidase family protein [Xanthobacteraceae bacterium]
MPTQQEMTAKFWKHLHRDRTLMLGVEDAENGHFRPMTALLEHETGGPIWIFTSQQGAVANALQSRKKRAMAAYSAKGHDLFATVHGTIQLDMNREMIDKLWNPFIAAWFKGKDDPKLALLRFDAARGEIWLNENSLWAGVKMLLGSDPKEDYKEKVAKVALGGGR